MQRDSPVQITTENVSVSSLMEHRQTFSALEGLVKVPDWKRFHIVLTVTWHIVKNNTMRVHSSCELPYSYEIPNLGA